METSNVFIDIAKKGRTNPDALQRMQIQYAETMVDGPVSINSAGNPFVSIFEMNAVISAMQATENIAQLSNIYPSLTSNEEELSKHMTFKDHMGRWSYPSKSTFTIGLPLQQLRDNAIALNDGSGTKRLTIPGMSAISVSGATFTMQYPINISILNHGSIVVEYDTTRPSPLYIPESSSITATYNLLENIEMIYIPFEIYQIAISSQSTTISAVAGFEEEYGFDDKFFMCRAYRTNASGAWEEFEVTYSDVTYDPTIPTLVASVDPLLNKLSVNIPQIYLSSGMLQNQIRIDIYTTKGKLDLTLENFTAKSFSANWINPDAVKSVDPLGFSSRMGMFGTIYLAAEQAPYGGANAITFNELRNRVILRSTRTEGPPTSDLQVSNDFKDSGFVKTTVIDNIDDRQFLATQPLPKPVVNTETVTTSDVLPFAVSSIGSVVLNKVITLNELALADTVIDNGNRLTVLPTTLYSLVNGVVEIVPDSYVKTLKNTSITTVDQLTNIVNNAHYYYTPFFYVHDISANEYEVRPYSLSSPKVVRKYAVLNNDTLGLSAGVTQYALEIMPDYSGWRYTFTLTTSEVFKELTPDQVNLQFSYLDENSGYRTIFNGVMTTPIDSNTGKPIDGKYAFEVIVPTNWDIDSDDLIRIGTGSSSAPLLSNWDIVIFLKNYMPIGATKSEIESAYNPILMPDFENTATYVGLSQEQLNMNLGYHLDKLWKRETSTIEPWMYEKYLEDIPALYSVTIYKTTPAGDIEFKMNAAGTMLERVVLHAIGDPVLDSNGKQVMSYYKGQTKLDPITKEPILIEGERGILRHFDMVLLDGKYYFATADAVVTYRQQSVDTLVTWNNGVIKNLSAKLIGQTKLYYHPTATTGIMRAFVGDGILVTMEADQQLSIDITVPNQVYKNTTLRRNLKVAIIQTVDTYLSTHVTLSQSELLNAVRDAIADDQIGIEISGLFNNEYEAITVAYNSIGPSIGKRLITDSALNATIEDSISIDFSRHRTTTLR